MPDEDEIYIWYGSCGYWTEDWTQLANHRGMPICPICGQPGAQAEKTKWVAAVTQFNLQSPGGAEFVLAQEQNCITGNLQKIWNSFADLLK